MMSTEMEEASARSDWLDELGALLARHSGMGIGADVASMSWSELRGVYRRLQRLEEGATAQAGQLTAFWRRIEREVRPSSA